MKRLLGYSMVCLVVILSMLLVSCSSQSNTSTSSATQSSTGQSTTKTSTAQSTSTVTSVSTASGTAANWWDKLGEPKYGGSLTVRSSFGLSATSFDPNFVMGPQAYQWEYDTLFMNDWTVDRDIWSFKPGFVPVEYIQGCLAESWEQVSPTMVKINLHQGIRWQNTAPLNGRELTAYDVQYSCERQLGTGSGFTEGSMMSKMQMPNIEKIVATDNYTLEVYFNSTAALNILQLVNIPPIIAPEWVEQGDLQNWKNAVGSGPWTVSEYTPGVSLTFANNPDYWGFDERHPENQIPYLDELKVMEIQDASTALAAFRTGQIDMSTISIQQAIQMAKTNPDTIIDYWPGPAYNIDMRCDKEPFTDIRVRKAMEIAFDRPTIAKTLFGGVLDPTPCGLLSPLMQGWIWGYDQWSDELKSEYAYNPDKAKELLTEAGYPDGFSTNIVVSSAQNAELIQTIKAFLAEIGVNADIKVLDATAFEAYQNERKHDQMTIETKAGSPGGPSMAFALRYSKGVQNYCCVDDAYYDGLYGKFNSVTDMNEAKEAGIAMDKYVIEQHWSVSLFPIDDPVAVQSRLKGFDGEFMMLGTTPGSNFARMWVSE